MSRLDQELVSVTSFLCLVQVLNIAGNVRMTHSTTARHGVLLKQPLLGGLHLSLCVSSQVISPQNGRYQIDSDVLLVPWKLTYRNIGSGFIPRGAFGKVYLAQDMKTKKRMACKLVCTSTLCV